MLRLVSTRAMAMRPASLSALGAVRSHCQVPCGIFDDPARVEALKEDAATVRKAMVQINELAGGDALALNQVGGRTLRASHFHPAGCAARTRCIASANAG